MKKDGSSDREHELRAARAVLARSLIALLLWCLLMIWLVLPTEITGF